MDRPGSGGGRPGRGLSQRGGVVLPVFHGLCRAGRCRHGPAPAPHGVPGLDHRRGGECRAELVSRLRRRGVERAGCRRRRLRHQPGQRRHGDRPGRRLFRRQATAPLAAAWRPAARRPCGGPRHRQGRPAGGRHDAGRKRHVHGRHGPDRRFWRDRPGGQQDGLRVCPGRRRLCLRSGRCGSDPRRPGGRARRARAPGCLPASSARRSSSCSP